MGIAFKVTIAILSLLLVSVAYADIWYVHPDSALNSIQAGLDSCAATDTVLVGPGTYYENLVWPDVQSIVLMSEYGPDTTIIDGDSSGNVIYIHVEIDSTTIIDGFTIQNGGMGGYGGGIFVNGDFPSENYSPMITNNIITGNYSSYLYGAISCNWSSPVIHYNTIIDNSGNGIYCYACVSIINNNTITDNGGSGIEFELSGGEAIGNTITGNGKGISCFQYSGPYISGNTIAGNLGLGIHLLWTGAIIFGNTINENMDSGIGCYDAYPTIDHCTISNNSNHGIHITVSMWEPEIYYNNIINNIAYGIYNGTDSIVNAEYNWWGDASGPGGFGPGTGDEVSEYVDYEPWLTDSVGVEEECTQNVISNLKIHPNPFRDRVTIKLQIAKDKLQMNAKDHIKINIYNSVGRLVKNLSLSTAYSLVSTEITWDGKDDFNRKLPSGVYLLKFTVGDYTETEKLLLLR